MIFELGHDFVNSARHFALVWLSFALLSRLKESKDGDLGEYVDAESGTSLTKDTLDVLEGWFRKLDHASLLFLHNLAKSSDDIQTVGLLFWVAV